MQSKTLAQCVEFYYTYKKQVKVGRSGMLIYGAPDPEDRVPEVAQSYTLFTFTVRIESKVWTKNLVGI